MRSRFFVAICVLLGVQGVALSADVNDIFTKGEAKWADLQSDTGPGSVAAAHMLGIGGDGVATVENVKGLVTSLKGLSTQGGKGTLALGIAPARTSFAPMDLSTYAGAGRSMNGTVARILGSTSFGYAQGATTLSGHDFDRRAVSVQTSWYLRDRDDPILALAMAVRDESGAECKFVLQPAKPPLPAAASAPGGALSPSAPTGGGGANTATAATTGATRPQEVDAADAKQRFSACSKRVAESLKWNRSIASLSASRGWIRPSDGSAAERSMGTAFTANLTLGFNPEIASFNSGLALTLGHRRTLKEPILATLTQAAPQPQNTSLTLIRLTGGGDKSRLLFEASNARKGLPTESQRTFKHAVGFDMQLAPEVWLNFRAGRQQAISDNRLETGSLLSLSWSPKALMDVGFGK